MDDWLRRYPPLAARHRDAHGRHPAHSFFYPWDEFDDWEFGRLVELCGRGWGEVELHLHHRNDTEFSLRRKLREAVQTYRQYGALSVWPDGKPAWGFVHGDWALNNSRSSGERNFCGVNHEIEVLKGEGCYADFTFPAWQHTAQPRMVNRIYYAKSNAARPKGHDRGEPARVGGRNEEGLLLIQGPLVPYFERRGMLARFAMEDSDLASYRRYTPERLDRWVRAGIRVEGRPDRIFIKLHTHGAPEANRQALLDADLEALFSDAEARYNDGKRFRLHYVTAREMFNIIHSSLNDPEADLEAARDAALPPPATVPVLSGKS